MDKRYISLPLYQCVKRARICRIRAVERNEGGCAVIPNEQFLDPVPVPAEFIDFAKPRPGSYLIVSETGHLQVISPTEFAAYWLPVDHLEDRRRQLEDELDDVEAAIAAKQQQKERSPA